MTTYYFIRHAEKEHNGLRDPHLTEKGKERAENWAKVLGDKNIELIYCTNYKRTRETAKPLAEKLRISIEIYEAGDLYTSVFQKETHGKTVLVVGHQDTTPAFVNRVLGDWKYPQIKDENNGNLYCVTIDGDGNINSELSHISF